MNERSTPTRSRTACSMLTLHSPYQRWSGPTGPSTSAGAAGSTGASAAVWPGVVLSAYTEIVDTKDQWPTWSASAESACRAWLTWRVTSTTASKPLVGERHQGVRVVAVDRHEPGPGRHDAGDAPGRAGHVVALVEGELRHRPAEEPGATENEDPHPPILRCR